MIDTLIGADEIIEALLNHGKSQNEKRSHTERYNLIIKAIYGEDADSYLIRRTRGRPVNNREDTVMNLVLVEMYEAENQYEDHFRLAEAFIDKIFFQGTRRNAIKALADKFSKRRDEFGDQRTREIIRDDAKIFGAQKGYIDEYYDQLRQIVDLLSSYGWDIKI